jgi:hypothetical protein
VYIQSNRCDFGCKVLINNTNGQYRYILLTTVSAAALFVGIERGAHAQDAMANGAHWYLSLEGQYLMFGGDGPDNSSLNVDPEKGWGGAVEFGIQQYGSPWSAVARVRYGRSNKESSTYSGFYGPDTDQYEESHAIVDLEIGRDVGLGSMGGGDATARIHGGVRFAHFDGDQSGSYSSFYGSSSNSSEHTFSGIGPRVGIDANIPFADNVSADLRASGAVLFGTRKVEGTYSGFYSAGSFSRRDSGVVVPNVEASAAVSYLFGEHAKLSVGYRVDQYWNVLDMNGSPGGGSRESDRTIHGPFLRVTIGGSGPN